MKVEQNIYIWEKKTNKLRVHPYKPVSWSPTHQGIIIYMGFSHIYIYICFANGEKNGASFCEEEIEEAFVYPSDLVNTNTTIPLRVSEER